MKKTLIASRRSARSQCSRRHRWPQGPPRVEAVRHQAGRASRSRQMAVPVWPRRRSAASFGSQQRSSGFLDLGVPVCSSRLQAIGSPRVVDLVRTLRHHEARWRRVRLAAARWRCWTVMPTFSQRDRGAELSRCECSLLRHSRLPLRPAPTETTKRPPFSGASSIRSPTQPRVVWPRCCLSNRRHPWRDPEVSCSGRTRCSPCWQSLG